MLFSICKSCSVQKADTRTNNKQIKHTGASPPEVMANITINVGSDLLVLGLWGAQETCSWTRSGVNPEWFSQSSCRWFKSQNLFVGFYKFYQEDVVHYLCDLTII